MLLQMLTPCRCKMSKICFLCSLLSHNTDYAFFLRFKVILPSTRSSFFNIVTSCSHYKTPRLHLGTNIMPQMRSPPAWSRQPTVPKDASPNGWRQGQCGTTARAAASDLDRGPLEKPVVAAMPLEGIWLERRKTRKWASSLMEAEESRFTLEDPDVQQGPAKYPQCRTRERFARILPVCIFF